MVSPVRLLPLRWSVSNISDVTPSREDMRVIEHEQDIGEIIDSWDDEERDKTQLKLIFKDPTKVRSFGLCMREGDWPDGVTDEESN